MMIGSRINRLEERLMPPDVAPKGYCRLVTEATESEERERLRSEGVDPDGANVIWIMLVPGRFKMTED